MCAKFDKNVRWNYTAYLGIAVAAGPFTELNRTKQVGTHQAVYARNNSLKILMVKGPGGPGVDGKQILILPAGNYEQTKVARPRSRGTEGRLPLSGGDGPKGQRG